MSAPNGDVRIDFYLPEGSGAPLTLISSPLPINRGSKSPVDEFNEQRRWIGPNRAFAHKRMTTNAFARLDRIVVARLFDKYDERDYGSGEAGFAKYNLDAIDVWLIDDAVRSPKFSGPARDAETTPGPQTLMLAEEYSCRESHQKPHYSSKSSYVRSHALQRRQDSHFTSAHAKGMLSSANTQIFSSYFDWIVVRENYLNDAIIEDALKRWYYERYEFKRGHWSQRAQVFPTFDIELNWEDPSEFFSNEADC